MDKARNETLDHFLNYANLIKIFLLKFFININLLSIILRENNTGMSKSETVSLPQKNKQEVVFCRYLMCRLFSAPESST